MPAGAVSTVIRMSWLKSCPDPLMSHLVHGKRKGGKYHQWKNGEMPHAWLEYLKETDIKLNFS